MKIWETMKITYNFRKLIIIWMIDIGNLWKIHIYDSSREGSVDYDFIGQA
jgi:hypothetical protein